jgi:hypothetical protein
MKMMLQLFVIFLTVIALNELKPQVSYDCLPVKSESTTHSPMGCDITTDNDAYHPWFIQVGAYAKSKKPSYRDVMCIPLQGMNIYILRQRAYRYQWEAIQAIKMIKEVDKRFCQLIPVQIKLFTFFE